MPAIERFPALVSALALEKKLMLPVLTLPNWRVCLFVVPKTPVPVKKLALLPELAETLAVGTPELTLMKANLADVVALLPSKRSCVAILSRIDPFACSNGDPPLRTGRMPVTSVAPVKFTSVDERTPVAERWAIPRPSEENLVVPLMVVVPVPFAGDMAMFPVDPPPRVNVCALVVPSFPSAVRKVVLLLPAEREAVGTPELTLMKANLALDVAVSPSKRS